MATLYRKYRPQKWSEAEGQNQIKLTLENEISSGRLAHAYLFCGTRGVGKTTLARLLAKSINCENRKEDDYEPCNICSSCQDIMAGKSMDIVEMDAASHTGVDNVRDNIITSARVAPIKSKYKVFIIDEVHMLSISAFNALLKTLEEPPAQVIFVLCTTEIHKVPETIISRCQRFDFKRISVNDITKKLSRMVSEEKLIIDNEVLESIARQSGGHMRDAESMLGQLVAIAGGENNPGGKAITREEADLVIPRSSIDEVVNLIGFLIHKDAAAGIKLVNQLVDEGVDMKNFITDLIEVLRKLMMSKISPALADKLGLEFGENLEMKLNEMSKETDVDQLVRYLEKMIEARNKIKESFIIQLPIELAIVGLCQNVTYRPASPDNSNTGTRRPAEPRPAESNPAINKDNQSNDPISINSISDLTNDQIVSRWNEVLAKIKKYNHSLSFILRVCQPRDLRGNRLCLAFKYKFHKDRLSETSIKVLVEKVLQEVYGASLMIEPVIDPNLSVAEYEAPAKGGELKVADAASAVNENEDTVSQPQERSDSASRGGSDMINNLLKTFGGRIVN